MDTEERLRSEIGSFQKVWRGGYYEGDPLDPVGASSYREFGYMSILHVVYLTLIRLYVTSSTRVLEIGPGRGAWTKTMLHAAEVWCLDAKPREENDIDRFLGYPANLRYFQVSDFECRDLPYDYFDYVFSFGALCHVSPDGICAYARNLYPRLKSGANLFLLVGDYDKNNHMRAHSDQYDVISRVMSSKRAWFINAVDKRIGGLFGKRAFVWGTLPASRRSQLERLLGARPVARTRVPYKDKREDLAPRPGRWFHSGAKETARMFAEYGYSVVSEDVGVVHRDPILHLRKP